MAPKSTTKPKETAALRDVPDSKPVSQCVDTPAPKRKASKTCKAPVATSTQTERPKPTASDSAMMDLDVGSVKYSCTCTKDPTIADEWAADVLKGVGDANVASAPAVVVGMDCEWAAPWYRAPGAPDRLATLQLFHHGPQGMRALVFAVAELNGELPPGIVSLFGDVRVVKVGANIAGDATRVVRDFGCPVRGLYDLARLNKKPGSKLTRSMSLEAVVRAHCPQEMHISKAGADVRTSNWEEWPLTEEQILYASRDAALGLMAFMAKFGISTASSPDLPKASVDALGDLDEVLTPCADTQADSAQVLKRPAATSTAAPGADDNNNANFFQHMRNANVKPPNIGKKSHPEGSQDALADVCVIVSGTLDSFERADFEKYVQRHGGKVAKSVTAKVTHLVTDHGEAGPSKLAKCKELGIPVVSEDVILSMVGHVTPNVPAVTEEVVKDVAVPKASAKRPRKNNSSSTSAVHTDAPTATIVSSDTAPGVTEEGVKNVAVPKASAKRSRNNNSSSTSAVHTDAPKATTVNSDTAPEVTEEGVKDVAVPKASAKRPRKNSARSTSAAHTDAPTAATVNSDSASAGKPPQQSTTATAADAPSLPNKAEEKEPYNLSKRATTTQESAPKKTSRFFKKSSEQKKESKTSESVEETTIEQKGTKQASVAPSAQTHAENAGVDSAANETDGVSNGARRAIATPVRKRSDKPGPTPPKKKVPKVSPEIVEVELDDKTLELARGLSMESALRNLASRPEVQGKGLSAASLLTALKESNGLVNAAKHKLAEA